MKTTILNIPFLQKSAIEKKQGAPAASCCTPKDNAAVCCTPSELKSDNDGACCAQPANGSACCNK